MRFPVNSIVWRMASPELTCGDHLANTRQMAASADVLTMDDVSEMP